MAGAKNCGCNFSGQKCVCNVLSGVDDKKERYITRENVFPATSKKFILSLSLYYIQFMTFLVNLVTYFPLLAGCANGCSGKGQCTLEDGEYRCDCKEGWAGSDCSIALELNCKDNIDNDNGKFSNPLYKIDLTGKKITVVMDYPSLCYNLM